MISAAIVIEGKMENVMTEIKRDEFGEKPLYYSLKGNNGTLVYGDSVRDLLDKGVPRKISKEGLSTYLSYGCLYAPYTMIDGIWAVPPGCKAVIKGNDIRIERYWLPSFETRKLSQEEAQREINKLLEISIKKRTQDGNPSAFLSGGIDSSAIVALWRKQYKGEIRTYCVTHEDPRLDERQWARMVANANKTKHVDLMLEDRMIRAWLDEAVASYDQPSVDGLNFWFATKLLKESTDEKIVLSGEGGDELFMGYGRFYKHRMAYKYGPIMRFFPRFCGQIIDACTRGFARTEKYRKLAMLAGFEGEPYYVPRRILAEWQIKKLLKPELFIDMKIPQPFCQGKLPDDVLNRISWLEMQTVLPDMWLRDGYQTSSHNGIALRTPLCDVKLVEFLYKVPGHMKCDSLISKPLLVRAAGCGIPEECAKRKKQGFSLPFDRYFAGAVKERIDEFLSGKATKLFDPHVIYDVGRRYRNGKLYWNRIWQLFMVEDWCNRNRIEL